MAYMIRVAVEFRHDEHPEQARLQAALEQQQASYGVGLFFEIRIYVMIIIKHQEYHEIKAYLANGA